MILTALVHLYEELCRQGKIAREGWGTAKVSHRILLNQEGKLCGVISARKKVQKKNKEIEVSYEMRVPLPVTRSSGVKANFLCDNSSYFLGIDDKGNPLRTKQCFEAARRLHHQVLARCESPSAKAILRYFDTWDLGQATENPIIKDQMEDILAGNQFVFQVDGVDVIEEEDIKQAWESYQKGYGEEDGDSALLGQCLITGKDHQKIAILHPKIKGVSGAQMAGASLVSFNAPAFCSYGGDGEQGANAPVSERAAFAYGSALNALITDKSHTQLIGDTTLVYWSEHAISACQDFMGSFLGKEAVIDDAALETVVKRIREGFRQTSKG